MTSLDSDRDRRVSRNEVSVGVVESFADSDQDDDGFLSPIEFQNWSLTYLGVEHTTPGRLQFDLNQDGRVSSQEFAIVFNGVHGRMDADKDGLLARNELLVEIAGLGIDAEAIRAQMEAEMRGKMSGKVRDVCQRGRAL